MRMKKRVGTILLAAAGITMVAYAHDPEEHMKNAEKPKCEAMAGIDRSELDMSDPVTQAMMKQCKQEMHNDNGHDRAANSGQHEPPQAEGSKAEEHKH